MPAFAWLTLAAALAQALGFLLSKRLWLYARDPWQVAVSSQLAVAAGAALALPFVGLGGLAREPLALAGVVACALSGQVLFAQALRHGDASFVVPMLGLKLFAVAGLTALLLSERYGPGVYLGAAGAFASLFLLSDGTLRGSVPSALYVSGASVLFGAADTLLMYCLRSGLTVLETGVYTMVLPALLLGPLAAYLTPRRWPMSRPLAATLGAYAAFQLVGFVLMMAAFALARGATLVNIVQSARGVFVVAVVYLLGRAGVRGIERLTRAQLRTRSAGAALMAVSVGIALLTHS
jgi:drug/metabolite transporter (DMT)-like permease